MLCIYCHWPREAVSVNLQVLSSVPLCSPGDSSEPDEHPTVRPYLYRENAPSYDHNNASSSITDSSQQTHPHLHPPEEDPLGPLPDSWEMAYTETGEVYYIEYVHGPPPLPITLCRASPAREECATAISIKKGKCISNSVYSPLPSASIRQT